MGAESLRLSSNILRSDYAGSAACARCHADIYARWLRSPMHNMTRLPEKADIATPFHDSVFRFKDDRAILTQEGGARFLRIESPRFGDHLFRITKVIGGHHREDFVGLEVLSATPSAGPLTPQSQEQVLPISFILSSHKFRYKGYSVMSKERPGLKPGAVWSRTCIFCHNTVPYLSTILGTLSGPGTPPYQGEVVDPLLPPERRQTWTVTNESALRAAVQKERDFLSGGEPAASAQDNEPSLQAVLRQGVRYTRGLFKQSHLIEVGIGCESCHGGSKEHVEDSRKRPSYLPKSSFLQVLPQPKSNSQAINRVCARCHQVLFTHYPYTWEGGTRQQNPGGSNINSGEARDFLLGSCAGQFSCVGCHDPHATDEENKRELEALETRAGNEVCLRCHAQYRQTAALQAHSHHDPNGPGSLCLNCHMAKKNMSLDTRLSRYHRIGSPTDKVRVQGDRPLECALCHADRSVASLLSDMERLYGKSYDKNELRALYGDLDDNVMLATLKLGKPHEQAVAMAVLGREHRRDAVPLLAQQLVHPLPILRYYALQALEQILGTSAPFDLHQENAGILAAARQWIVQSGVILPSDSLQKSPAAPEPSSSPDDD
jgi:predicted CXXCH cytochrome family protein